MEFGVGWFVRKVSRAVVKLSGEINDWICFLSGLDGPR